MCGGWVDRFSRPQAVQLATAGGAAGARAWADCLASGLTLTWRGSNPCSRVITAHGMRAFLLAIATHAFCQPMRAEWIRDACAAGQREIEVGSFMPARLLPQLADTAELVSFAKTLPDLFVPSPAPRAQPSHPPPPEHHEQHPTQWPAAGRES